MGYTVFPFAVRVYATLEGLFLISSIAAIISFSSGTVMTPAARKWIVIGTPFLMCLVFSRLFFYSPFFVWDKRRDSKGTDYNKMSNSKGDSYIVGAFKKMPNRIADLAIASVALVIGNFSAAGKIPPLRVQTNSLSQQS